MRIETKAKLDYLKGTKSAIADALVEKGQTVSSTDTFRSYADKVRAIKSGGGLEPGVYYKKLDFFRYDSNPQTYIWFNGELYCFSHPETYVFDIYKRDGSAWNKIISQIKLNPGYLRPVFLNGKMHIIGYKTHFVFDGTTITQLNDVPSTTIVDSRILYNGKLVLVDQTTFYEWQESTDTWKTLVTTQANPYDDYWYLCVSNGELYALCGRDLFHYSNGTITNIAYLADRSYLYNHNGYMYMTDGKYNFFRYDPDTQTEKNLGDWIRFPTFYDCPSDTPTQNKFLTVGKYSTWMDCVEVVIVEDES